MSSIPKKTVKACDTCRRRKVKCSGTENCTNCVKANIPCTFNHVEKKRHVSRRVSKKQISTEIGSRLTKLEDIICQVLDTSSSGRNTTSNAKDDDEFITHMDETMNKKATVYTSFEFCNHIGTKWLFEHTEGKDVMVQFMEMHMLVDKAAELQKSLFTDPIEQPSELPPYAVLKEIGEAYCMGLMCPQHFISGTEVLILLSEFETPKNHNFAELFMLNAVSVWGCHVKKLTTQDPYWAEMEHEFLVNSVYYFRQMTIVPLNEPRALQAVLALGFYITSNTLLKVDQIMAFYALRIAQYLGLHRRERYVGKSPMEIAYEKRLWWACCVFDKWTSIRCGQPPVLSHSEFEHLISESDFLEFLDNLYLCPSFSLSGGETGKLNWGFLAKTGNHFSDRLLDSCGDLNGFTFTIGYHYIRLAEISQKIYERLFSASAYKLQKDESACVKVVDELNGLLDNWKDKLPPMLKPDAVCDMVKFIASQQSPLLLTNTLVTAVCMYGELNLFNVSVNLLPFKIKMNENPDADHKSLMKGDKYIEKCLSSVYYFIELLVTANEQLPQGMFFAQLIFPIEISMLVFTLGMILETKKHGSRILTLMQRLIDTTFTNSSVEYIDTRWKLIAYVVRLSLKVFLKFYDMEDDVVPIAVNVEQNNEAIESLRVQLKANMKSLIQQESMVTPKHIRTSPSSFGTTSPSTITADASNLQTLVNDPPDTEWSKFFDGLYPIDLDTFEDLEVTDLFAGKGF